MKELISNQATKLIMWVATCRSYTLALNALISAVLDPQEHFLHGGHRHSKPINA